MPVYLGVDPGAKGSLCFLDPYGDILFFDTPNIIPGKTPSFNDLSQELLFRTVIPNRVAIEDVHSLYGMSARSNFNFGRNLQAVHDLIRTVYQVYELVTPKVWQAAVGIPSQKEVEAKFRAKKRKEAIAEKALWLYPGVMLHGSRGGLLDGRADALMIAHYLRLKYGDKDATDSMA